MTNCHLPNFRHSYQSPLPPLHPILTFSFSVRLCPYKSFGAALLQWHWVLSSSAVNSASPCWRWPFFLLSTLLPVCDKFCLGAQGASAVGCRLDLPLLARVVFSAIRRVLLASCSRPTPCSSDTPRLLRRRRLASHCFLPQFHFFLFCFHLAITTWSSRHPMVPFYQTRTASTRLSMASNFAISAVISMFRRRFMTDQVKRSTLSPYGTSKPTRHLCDLKNPSFKL